MDEIEKIREDLYIKKGWDGYRVVHPFQKDLSKPFSLDNANWPNVLYGGHWSNILKALVVLIIFYFIIQMYVSDVQQCNDAISKQRSFNITITDQGPQYLPSIIIPNIDISNVTKDT